MFFFFSGAEKAVIERQAVDSRAAPGGDSDTRADPFMPAQPIQSWEPDVAVLPRRRSQRKFPGPAGILPPAVREHVIVKLKLLIKVDGVRVFNTGGSGIVCYSSQ